MPVQLAPSVVGQLCGALHMTLTPPLLQLGGEPPVSMMFPQQTCPPPQSEGLAHAKPASIAPELDPLLPPLPLLLLLPLPLPLLLPPPLLLPLPDPVPVPPELEPVTDPELEPPLPPAPELDGSPLVPPPPPVPGSLLQPTTTTIERRQGKMRMRVLLPPTFAAGVPGTHACRSSSPMNRA